MDAPENVFTIHIIAISTIDVSELNVEYLSCEWCSEDAFENVFDKLKISLVTKTQLKFSPNNLMDFKGIGGSTIWTKFSKALNTFYPNLPAFSIYTFLLPPKYFYLMTL